MNLDKAYKNFFRDKSVGFPKFKSKKTNRFSYTTNNQNGTISIEGNFVKIPKLKSKIKIVLHRQFKGLIKSATISKTPSNQYYISILVDTENIQLPKNDNKIGIDLGLKEFAICSNGIDLIITKILENLKRSYLNYRKTYQENKKEATIDIKQVGIAEK